MVEAQYVFPVFPVNIDLLNAHNRSTRPYKDRQAEPGADDLFKIELLT